MKVSIANGLLLKLFFSTINAIPMLYAILLPIPMLSAQLHTNAIPMLYAIHMLPSNGIPVFLYSPATCYLP